MRIIDELTRNPDCYDPQAGFAPSSKNPVLFLNDEGRPWTLGMVLSMWQFLFEQGHREVCGRRIPF